MIKVGSEDLICRIEFLELVKSFGVPQGTTLLVELVALEDNCLWDGGGPGGLCGEYEHWWKIAW
jgi:hypothetical protein